MLPKLIIGLNTLQKEDWTPYRKYLLMQTKEDSEAFKCFSLLQKQRAKLTEFDTAKWHTKYVPQLSEKSLLNTFSKLYLWLEEWIVYNELQKNKIRSGIELVKHWNRAGEYKLADSKARQVQTFLDENDKYSPELNYEQYRLYYYQFYSDNPIKNKEPDLIFNMLDSFVKTVDDERSMLLSQLEFWNHIKIVELSNFEHYKEMLCNNSNSEITLKLYKLIESDDLEAFYYCTEYLYRGNIPREDDFFTKLTMYLLTYSRRLWHKKAFASADPIIKIYEFALDTNVLLNAGNLPLQRYLTIINSLGVFKSSEWTNKFIEKWASKVDSTDLEGTINIGKAFYHFHRKEYYKSFSLLQRVNTKYISTRAVLHRLSIMIYYETRSENFYLLQDALSRYYGYLTRNSFSLSKEQLESNNNFRKTVVLLLKKENNSVKYEQYLPSNNTKWLIEKKKEIDQHTKG